MSIFGRGNIPMMTKRGKYYFAEVAASFVLASQPFDRFAAPHVLWRCVREAPFTRLFKSDGRRNLRPVSTALESQPEGSGS